MLDLGLPIVADEVFLRYPLREGARLPSALEADRGLVLALSGLSKEAALPQMKLAWIALAGDRALVAEAKARLEVLADTFLSVGTPIQIAAPILLADATDARARILTRARTNIATIDATLVASAATRLHVEAGIYATLRLPSILDEEAWTRALLDAGVYVHPGAFFDFETGPFVVVSLLTPEAVLAEGIARIVTEVAARTR